MKVLAYIICGIFNFWFDIILGKKKHSDKKENK